MDKESIGSQSSAILANLTNYFTPMTHILPNKAGIALLIKVKIYNQSFRDEIFEVVQGRVITIRLHLKKGCLALTSIHNFELNEAL